MFNTDVLRNIVYTCEYKKAQEDEVLIRQGDIGDW